MEPEPSRPALSATGRSTAWKLPAVAVAAVLVGIVAVGRLGPAPAPAPTETPTRSDQPSSSPPDLTVAMPVNGYFRGVFTTSRDGLTYADGIPTLIGGEPVHRVQEAVAAALGTRLLVGGWYRPQGCGAGGVAARCPSATLSDVPLVAGAGDVRTTFIALNTRLDGSGAHVILGKVVADPRCAIHADGGQCQPRLKVLQELWSGPG